MFKLNYYEKHYTHGTSFIYFLDLFLGNNIISSSVIRKIINGFNHDEESVTEFLKLRRMQYQLLPAIYDKFDSLEVLIKTRS